MLLQCEVVRITMRLTEQKHVVTFPLMYRDVDLGIGLIPPLEQHCSITSATCEKRPQTSSSSLPNRRAHSIFRRASISLSVPPLLSRKREAASVTWSTLSETQNALAEARTPSCQVLLWRRRVVKKLTDSSGTMQNRWLTLAPWEGTANSHSFADLSACSSVFICCSRLIRWSRWRTNLARRNTARVLPVRWWNLVLYPLLIKEETHVTQRCALPGRN